MLNVMEPYQDRITFVHVDIYKSLTDTKLSPTVEAWNLPSEPWLYGIDSAGTITATRHRLREEGDGRALRSAGGPPGLGRAIRRRQEND